VTLLQHPATPYCSLLARTKNTCCGVVHVFRVRKYNFMVQVEQLGLRLPVVPQSKKLKCKMCFGSIDNLVEHAFTCNKMGDMAAFMNQSTPGRSSRIRRHREAHGRSSQVRATDSRELLGRDIPENMMHGQQASRRAPSRDAGPIDVEVSNSVLKTITWVDVP